MQAGADPVTHEFSAPLMGTVFRVRISTTEARDPREVEAAAEAAFEEARRLEQIYSDYRPDSAVNAVSHAPAGTRVAVPRELEELLKASLELSRESGGAFDVTQGRAIQEWRRSHRRAALPTAEQLQAAREAGGFQSLQVGAGMASLNREGVLLDLGGIAKGATADAMVALLRARGFPRAIVAASGDIRASQAPLGKSGWKIEVAPFGENHPLRYVTLLADAAISTSGDSHQWVEIDGRRYSHVIDPADGLGLRKRRAAVVVAPLGRDTDALATALCVMPPQAGLKLIEVRPQAEAVVFEEQQDGRVREFRPSGPGNQRVLRRAPLPLVGPVDDEIRRAFSLSPFYEKGVLVGGLPILGSGAVPDEALEEAAWILTHVTAARPHILEHLVAHRIRVVLMAHDELTTQMPEFAELTPARYWDRAFRGLGPSRDSPALLVGVENLLAFRGDYYRGESLLIHEFAHAVHRYGLGSRGQAFDVRLQQSFRKAKAAGLWSDTYAMQNDREYFAEGVQSWFEANRVNDRSHGPVGTREELMRYDPILAALVREAFGMGDWRFQPIHAQPRPAGWSRERWPVFQWPADLDAWFRDRFPHLMPGAGKARQ